MSIQSNFPNLKPSLLLDFANTKQLDNRITFTRSTPAVYYDGKTTAMAEQNLLYPSVNIGSPYQNADNALTNNTGTAPDGTTTASLLVPNTSNTRHYCSSPLGSAGTLNIPYTISVYAKANGYNYIFVQFSGSVSSGGSRYGVTFNITTGAIETSGFSYSVNVASTSSTITSVGNGWYRVTLTATLTSVITNPMCYVQTMPLNGSTYSDGGDGLPSYAGNGTSGAYFWGFQLEQRSAATAYTATTSQPITNYIPVLLTAGGNQPRFDCNPITGESLGLFIEEQRTNNFTYSQQLDQWNSSNYSVTTNTIISPDGTLTGDKIIPNSEAVGGYIGEYFTGTAGSIVMTGYFKAGENRRVSLWEGNVTAYYATFDLISGTVVGTNSAIGTITPVGNGWYRCSMVSTQTSGTRFWLISVLGDSATSPFATGLTGNGFNGLFGWGLQLEVGYFATSYIATTSASATRTADAARMTGTNFSSWWNQAQGTYYIENSYGSFSNQPIAISDTLGNAWSYGTNSGVISAYLVAPSLTSISSSVTATTNINYRSAFSYSSTGKAITASNTTPVTSSNNLLSNSADLLIGSFNTNYFINGRIKKIAYYPIAVTSTQLQAITS